MHSISTHQYLPVFGLTNLCNWVTFISVTGRHRKKYPPKHRDVLGEIRICLELGRYLDTRHSSKRREERIISLPDVIQVLRSGFHEKRKDKYREQYKAWSYSIRGKTVDNRRLRIVVSFESETGMLIITAVDLDAGD